MTIPTTHPERSTRIIIWARVAVVSGLASCFVLIAALAWYVIVIQGAAIDNLQREISFQTAYENALTARVYTLSQPTKRTP